MFKQVLSKLISVHRVVTASCQYGTLTSLPRVSLTGIQAQSSHSNVSTTGSARATSATGYSQVQQSRLLDQACCCAPAINLTTVRTAKFGYRSNPLKRIRKNGLEKRLSSHTQREILLKRFIKGKKVLTVFDRMMNPVPEKPRKASHRVQLFDKKKGIRAYIKPPEYYRF